MSRLAVTWIQIEQAFQGKRLAYSKENKTNGVTVTSNDCHRINQHAKNKFSIKNDEWYTVKDNIFDNNNWRQGKNEQFIQIEHNPKHVNRCP